MVIYNRLGPLNALNPMEPDGRWQLTLGGKTSGYVKDDNAVAHMLVVLAVCVSSPPGLPLALRLCGGNSTRAIFGRFTPAAAIAGARRELARRDLRAAPGQDAVDRSAQAVARQGPVSGSANPTKWPESPRIAIQWTIFQQNGRSHLGAAAAVPCCASLCASPCCPVLKPKPWRHRREEGFLDLIYFTSAQYVDVEVRQSLIENCLVSEEVNNLAALANPMSLLQMMKK